MSLQMKYFVLKPKGNSPFATASRGAMLRYADMIEGHEPALAKELRDWVLNETAEAHPKAASAESNRQMR